MSEHESDPSTTEGTAAGATEETAAGRTADGPAGVPTGDPGAAAAATPAGSPTRARRRPARLGTIVWGFLVLGFVVTVAAFRASAGIPDPLLWLTGAVLVGGVALIVVGVAAVLRRTD